MNGNLCGESHAVCAALSGYVCAMRNNKSNRFLWLQIALVMLALFVSVASGHPEPCVFAGGVVAAAPSLAVQPVNPWFDALKPGTFRALNNKDYTLSLTDVQTACAQINEQVKNWVPPIVKGHPQVASPREGSIKGARMNGEVMQLCAADLVPSFAEECKTGAYTNVSVSLYPDLTLRHLGVLGAHMPAVVGLDPISFGQGEFIETDKGKDSASIIFAAGETDLTTLAQSQDSLVYRLRWRLESARDLFRKIRDYIIDKDGLEKADSILPTSTIDSVDLGDVPSVSFSAPVEPAPATPAPSTAVVPGSSAAPADPARVEQERQLAEEKVARQKAEDELASFKNEKRTAEFAALCDNTIKAGRMTPAMRSPLEALFKAADAGNGRIEFGAGEPKDTIKVMESFLASMPTVIDLGAGDPKPPASSLSAEAVATKITVLASAEGIGTSKAFEKLRNQGEI